jgi:hypothetical protein
MNVAFIAEFVPLEDIKTGNKSKSGRYFKMKVLFNHEANEINEVIKMNIEEKSIILVIKVLVLLMLLIFLRHI